MIFSRSRIISLMLLSIPVFMMRGAPAQQMNQAQMQQMLQNSSKVQACLSKIDQSAIQALAVRGEQVEAEVKALCKAGNRAQAKAETLAFMRAINASKDMQIMRKCAASNPVMMQLIPLMNAGVGKNGEQINICDEAQSGSGLQ